MKSLRYGNRRTKIVCTIGPATGGAGMITASDTGGMDVARFNLSHGTFREHAGNIETVRKISRRRGTDVAILIDLPGPKYHVGKLKDDQVVLKRGSQVRLTTEDIIGDGSLIPVNLPSLVRDIKAGDIVILDDGAMELKVRAVTAAEMLCRVTVGGTLKTGKGLVIPGMRISAPFITDKLREAMRFAITQKPDFLALSFVTEAADIRAARTILTENSADIPLTAKIERGEAVKNFTSILAASDSIMVARGDLSVELPLERIPLIQKDLIRRCNRAGKPGDSIIITAGIPIGEAGITNMLKVEKVMASG